MLRTGDPQQIRKRIFICACVPAIDLFDDILIHRKRLIYEHRTNRIQERRSPGRGGDGGARRGAGGPAGRPRSPHAPSCCRDLGGKGVRGGREQTHAERSGFRDNLQASAVKNWACKSTRYTHTCCIHAVSSQGKWPSELSSQKGKHKEEGN